MKKHRLSLKQALDRVNKEEFEISYRKIENTLSDISKLFNISVSMVKRLANIGIYPGAKKKFLPGKNIIQVNMTIKSLIY